MPNDTAPRPPRPPRPAQNRAQRSKRQQADVVGYHSENISVVVADEPVEIVVRILVDRSADYRLTAGATDWPPLDLIATLRSAVVETLRHSFPDLTLD